MYKVLIVETNSLMSRALTHMTMRDSSFEILDCVKDEESIFRICESQEVDLIFLGATLMERSSVPIVQGLKKLDLKPEIYIISANRNDPFMKDFLKLRVAEYLILPLTFSKVAAILSAYKKRKKHTSEEPAVKEIFRVLEQRNYSGICEVAEAVTEWIMEKKDGRSEERMREIAKEIQEKIEVICNEKIELEKRFPIKRGFSDNPTYWNFWLTDLIDFAFQKAAISKCQALEKVFLVINDKLSEPLKLEQICLRCNISEGYLNKKIREFMGVSTMDYVQRRKLLEAKKKIAFSSMKFSDIAYELGYNESSYFSKVFKKYEGVTPIQYKRSIHNQQ